MEAYMKQAIQNSYLFIDIRTQKCTGLKMLAPVAITLDLHCRWLTANVLLTKKLNDESNVWNFNQAIWLVDSIPSPGQTGQQASK
ncbi:conserved hypothetical protein [Ricinus communis]|uniref:Uncharacterized protein n=1 Tax=Ricinus communis TaxID=3988 RepID=B9RT66_RICCO|nr:conserved hypothetical protein [Ricinus communis]